MSSKKTRNLNPLFVILLVVLTVYTLVMIFMLAWGVMTSFKDPDEYMYEKMKLPERFAWDNYLTIFREFKITQTTITKGEITTYVEGMAINSVLYSCVGAFIQAFVPCWMAYLAAKFNYKFSGVIYWIVAITMTIPIVGETPSAIQLMNSIGLYDTFPGNWIQKFSFLGMYFLVFYATYKGLPNDYAEAAYVDGAGETRIFFQIIFPLVRNMFFTVMLLKFIDFWNDYTTALLYLPSYPTLAYGVYYMTTASKGNDISKTPYKIASGIVLLIPILILFLGFKEKIMGNVSMGGVKE